MYGCESWTIRKAECWRINAFELWCWRRLLQVSWTARRSNQSILKEISPEYSLEGLMLKLQIPWPPDAKNWLTGKDCDAGKNWGQEKGATKVEIIGWHHQLHGYEFQQNPGDSEEQGRLVCCSRWGCKELDMTLWLRNLDVHQQMNGYGSVVHIHNEYYSCIKRNAFQSVLMGWMKLEPIIESR